MHKATVVMVVAATILILPGSPSSQHTFNSFSSAKELRKLRASTKNTQGRVTVPGSAVLQGMSIILISIFVLIFTHSYIHILTNMNDTLFGVFL